MNFEQRSARKFNEKLRREHDSRFWWRCLGGVIVGLCLAVGFGAAIRQQIQAHECGRQNVELQLELDELKNERQRLLHRQETALSRPVLLKKAEEIGLRSVSVEHLTAPNAALQSSFKVEPELKSKSRKSPLKIGDK